MPDVLERLTTALADRYRIERELGHGGMAIVFLAHDLKHDRQVAVKVVRPELTAVIGAERFLNEIKVTANLQHPHILPLFDSGETDALLYYVMPYVKGESLRALLDRKKQLPIDRALEITKVVASALGYAHRQGVIHRDIKPENVLLADDGEALVADFGIALAVNEAGGTRLTETGMSLGTPEYMSPEQATGDRQLEPASDIYSLGAVLYEMLVGDPPHMGNTAQAIVARIMTERPTTIRTVRDTVPEHVEQAVMKALAKVPADRPLTAERFVELLEAPVAPIKERRSRIFTRPIDALAASRRRVWWMGAGAAAAIVVVAVYGATILREGALTITTSNMVHVTNDPGLEFQPALSPDGREVAYTAVDSSGKGSIVIRSTINVAGGGEVRPTESHGWSHSFPKWTADGTSIRFSACRATTRECTSHQVGRTGGVIQTLDVPPHNRYTGYVWSLDGRRVAFAGRDSIFVYSVDDPNPRFIGVQAGSRRIHSLTWSPDGSRIAYVNGNPWWAFRGNASHSSIWVIDTEGGTPIRITDENYMDVSPNWLPGGNHLLFVSDRDGTRGVYGVAVGSDGPKGELFRIAGPFEPHSISISADGSKLAFSMFTWVQNIWSIAIPQTGSVSIRAAHPVTTGNQVIETHAISADGKWIAFESDRLGNMDIYKMSLDGGIPQMVTDLPGYAFYPSWSPDGREIAFYGYGETPGGKNEIWVVSADGGTPMALTSFPGYDQSPDWSPDGHSITFESQGPQGSGPTTMWNVSRDSVGGTWSDPVQLSDEPCDYVEWGPDGASFLCWGRGEIVIISVGGQVIRRLIPPRDVNLGRPHFSSDGRVIYFLGFKSLGSSGVWSIPVTGGEPTMLVAFDDPTSKVLGAGLSVHAGHFYLTVIEKNEADIWVADLAY